MKTVLYQNADWIITMDEERRRYRHADLLISGKEIKAIGKNLKDTLGNTVTIDEVVDASGRVILPGFVNTHHHTWQTLIRNIKATQGLRLEPWLTTMYEIYKDLNTDVALSLIHI